MTKEISVLFVDDEQSILNSLKRLFIKRVLLALLTTTSTQEAMDILAKEPIKVVLSDHRMPEVTGVQFFKRS